MRGSARPAASELIAETTELARQRQRLERLLVAAGPILVAVAIVAAGLLPAWIAALAAAAVLTWAVAGIGARDENEERAARRLDRGLDAKDTFLTWATVPDAVRGPLWPVVADRAQEVAAGRRPRPFVDPFAWRRPLLSLAASLAALGLLVLVVHFLPVAPQDRLEEIAAKLDATAHGAAGQALAGKLRALAKTLADPNASAEEKRRMAAEARAELEKQQKQQQGEQGQSGGQGQQQKPTDQKGAAAGEKGEQKGEAAGAGGEQQADRQAAANALGEIEKELAGESQGEKKDSKGGEQKQEQAKGGGVQGPSEGQKAGEKPGESDGNQPGPKEGGGKSEQGQGEGGRQSGEKPEGRNAQQPQGQKPEGQGTGEGAGASGKPSPADDGQKAERYYEAGQGPDGLRVEDGQFVKVLVPESEGGVGTERVQKPGEVAPETPFGNAPLPSEGPPGQADERQPLPLEYRPILRP